LKIQTVANFLETFYTVKVMHFISTKNGLGYILGYLFANSSGHPVPQAISIAAAHRAAHNPSAILSNIRINRFYPKFTRQSDPNFETILTHFSRLINSTGWSRFARLFLFRLNIPILVCFGGPWNGKCCYILV
jgi:hypothetical protein